MSNEVGLKCENRPEGRSKISFYTLADEAFIYRMFFTGCQMIFDGRG